MKKLLALLLAVCLLTCLTSAMGEPEKEALFRAKGGNGLWGYINREGVFVIPPQFDGAWDFRGDYAVITVYPEGYVPAREDLFPPDCHGIINRDGDIVVEPAYSFDDGYDGLFYGGKDTGIWLVNRWHDDSRLEGFFDISSGYFSGLVWGGVYGWVSDSRLIPVLDPETYSVGYADRTTGELIIPCLYYGTDPSNFIGGVAAVALDNEEGEPDGFFLINELGETIPLPEGISAVQYEGAVEGRVIVAQYSEDSTWVKPGNEENLYGYADAQGNVVIPPQFIYANEFQDGMAVVRYPEGDWACIDLDGNVLVRGLKADHWSGPEFENGMYALKTGENEFSLIDMQGQIVMTFACENLVELYPPNKDGICLFATDPSGRETYWKDRKFGRVNLAGEIIAEPVEDGYDTAPVYENGLAYVEEEDGRCGYIDTDGQEVYFWEKGK